MLQCYVADKVAGQDNNYEESAQLEYSLSRAILYYRLDDRKIFNLKRGIGIENENVCKQVRD